MADREMVQGKIKIVLKYILALTIPPALCAFMIPLFAALLYGTGLLERCPAKYVLFVSDAVDAIVVGTSGFIMSLLISWLARKREIMTTLFGVLIVIVVYVVVYIDLSNSIWSSYKFPEGFWRYALPREAVNGIFLLGFAMSGAWDIRRRRRLRAQKE